MLASAADSPDGNTDSPLSAASTTLCRVLHKYDVAKPCNILVRKGMGVRAVYVLAVDDHASSRGYAVPPSDLEYSFRPTPTPPCPNA